ncbi:helix-turn-helix domain-containing protein [Chryseomicrobium palamuruense]|uniref:Helix-turn-helix domain-containing protein n=1 Tax=Chryseomicrobium palamuruense TaxID=682973 RepID=A0ABV8UWB6_9BACL
MVISLEKYFSCEEVAERYGVKVITVWSWIREKKLKAIKTGKMYSIRPQDLEEFEESRRTK